jgi:hypothetical protein
MYRRNALERHGWNEDAKLEDYELYLRLSADGHFAFDPQVLSAWRQHSGNTSRDLTLLLNQCQDSQRRVSELLGISHLELSAIQKALRLRYVEEFARIGQKRKALSLMQGNLRGVASATFLARTAVRLIAPYRFVQWRRRLSQRRAHQRFGDVRS